MPKKKNQLRNTLQGLLSLVIVCAFSLILVETYFQITIRFDFVPKLFKVARLSAHQLTYFDPDDTPRQMVNASAPHSSYDGREDVLIKINSHGFRGAPPSQDPSKRIIFIGDSVVFSGALKTEETFSFQVQKQLREKLSDPKIEVLNLGTSDTNIKHYYLKLRNHALQYKPDLVVIGFYLNDLGDTQGSYIKKRKISSPGIFHSYTFEQLSFAFNRLNALLTAKKSDRFTWTDDFVSKNYENDQNVWRKMLSNARYDWGISWDRKQWKTATFFLNQMKELAIKNNFQLALLILPVSPQIEITNPAKNLFVPQEIALQVSRKLELALIDPLLEFRMKKDVQIYYDQCHLTKEGSKILAGILSKQLGLLLEKK